MDRCPYCGSTDITGSAETDDSPRCRVCNHTLPGPGPTPAGSLKSQIADTEIVIACPYCGYRSRTEADRLPDGAINLQCRQCSHSFPFDRQRALEKPASDIHPLFDRKAGSTSPPLRPRKTGRTRTPALVLVVLLLAAVGLFFTLKPSGSPPVDVSAFEAPERQPAARDDNRGHTARPQIQISAVNYRGRVLLNGKQIFVFEGEKDRLYDHLENIELVKGDNHLVVEYHRRHSSGAPRISIRLYQFDWETGEEINLASWTLRNDRGRKIFLLNYQPDAP